MVRIFPLPGVKSDQLMRSCRGCRWICKELRNKQAEEEKKRKNQCRNRELYCLDHREEFCDA